MTPGKDSENDEGIRSRPSPRIFTRGENEKNKNHAAKLDEFICVGKVYSRHETD